MRSCDRNMKEIERLKGKGRISYVVGLQLQLMKSQALLIPVCDGAQQPASRQGCWNDLQKAQNKLFALVWDTAAKCSEDEPDTEVQLARVKSRYMMGG